MSNKSVDASAPTASQRATYKFFVVAVSLFFIQIVAGVLTIHDFVGFTTFFGYNISENFADNYYTKLACTVIDSVDSYLLDSRFDLHSSRYSQAGTEASGSPYQHTLRLAGFCSCWYARRLFSGTKEPAW